MSQFCGKRRLNRRFSGREDAKSVSYHLILYPLNLVGKTPLFDRPFDRALPSSFLENSKLHPSGNPTPLELEPSHRRSLPNRGTANNGPDQYTNGRNSLRRACWSPTRHIYDLVRHVTACAMKQVLTCLRSIQNTISVPIGTLYTHTL